LSCETGASSCSKDWTRRIAFQASRHKIYYNYILSATWVAGQMTLFRWERAMAYVVNEACIKCKYMDCVEVCPVDCFYLGENMLVIHPDECIDCGVCEPECPAEAIVPDSASGAEDWLEHN